MEKTSFFEPMCMMNCARNRITCARPAAQSHASDDVVLLSPSSLACVIERSVPFFQCRPDSPCCYTLYQFIPLFSRSVFFTCFHCILTAFLRCGIYSMWMAWKLAGKKILIRCGKYSTKKSICENQHLYLIIYTWAALKANVISNDIVDNYRTMFESRTWAVRTEKLPFTQNLHILSWSYNMVGHAKKCVERYCELANKTTQQLYKSIYSMHRCPPLQRRRNKICWRLVTRMLPNCSEMLVRIGRPDILWSVKNLHDRLRHWTKACDKRLNRLIWYIHHTYKHYCHVGNTANNADWDFQDSDFEGDLENSKSTSGRTLCIFGSHTFVPISWMCKKQTSIS